MTVSKLLDLQAICCRPSSSKRPISEQTNGAAAMKIVRFPLEVVRRVRAAVGDDFIVIFRIAAMDMLQGGMSWDEIALLAKELEKAGASIISTHFVWHEANVPTIATMVPRAAFTRVTARVRKEVSIPVITSNPN